MTTTASPFRADIQDHAPRYRKYDSPPLSHRFFARRHALSLSLGVLVLLVLLFPQTLINRQLASGMRPTAATLAYLKLQLRAKPGQRALRLSLARAQLIVGQLEPAARTAKPLLDDPTPAVAQLWLRLQRARYVAAIPGTPDRDAAREAYRKALLSFAPQLGTMGLLAEIKHAVRSGLYDTAALLAEKLLTSPVVANIAPEGSKLADAQGTTPSSLGFNGLAGAAWSVSPSASAPSVNHPGAPEPVARETDIVQVRIEAFHALIASRLAAGDPVRAAEDAQRFIHLIPPAVTDWPHMMQIARWANRPAIGAMLAGRWLDTATSPEDRWQAFNALIGVYLAADKPREALAAAQANLDRMQPSARLWRRMTELAMQAGDTDKTALYARRMVHMGETDAH